MDALLPTHTLTTTRGLTYRYYATPSTTASKHTLLLLHGFPDSAEIYQFIVPALLTIGLRIIVPDLLGYGGTDKPEDPAVLEWRGQSADLIDILRKEGVQGNVIAVGHDWGSPLAQRFYLLHRSLCSGLITLNVALLGPFTQQFDVDAINAATEQAYGYPMYAYWKFLLPHENVKVMEQHLESCWCTMHGDEEDWVMKMFCVHGAMEEFIRKDRRVELKAFAREGTGLKERWIEGMKAGGFLAPTNWYRAIVDNHQLEAERSLEMRVDDPYLFIGCDGDPVNRPDAIEAAKAGGWCSDLTVRELKSGHWCLYEVPDQVAKVMVEWLGEKGFV